MSKYLQQLLTLFVLIKICLCTFEHGTKHRKYFDDYEKDKQQAILGAFKAKLLKLLDLENVPSVYVNNLTNPVPEPISMDSDRLMNTPNNKKRNTFVSRRARNKEITHKVSFEDELNEEEEIVKFNGSIVQQVTLLPSKLESENMCNEFHKKPHHQKKSSFVTLNCLVFDLSKHKEFTQNVIKNSNLYIRINLNRNLNYDLATHIYIEVNGILVKRISLIKIETDSDEYDSSDRDSVFDSADIKKYLNDQLSSSSESLLRVKVLFKNDYVNTNETKLRDLFSDLDENVALHVKFGGLKTNNKVSKRSVNGNKKHNNSKNLNVFKDCADLKKSGFKSSNFSCCRETMLVSFEQIGWGHFILSPKFIEYKYCRGGCLSGQAQVFSNTNIVYKVFEMNHSFDTQHCCNIHEYEDEITITYGSPPNYMTKKVSLNAKTCLCS